MKDLTPPRLPVIGIPGALVRSLTASECQANADEARAELARLSARPQHPRALRRARKDLADWSRLAADRA